MSRLETIPAWVAQTNCHIVVGDDGMAVVVDAPPEPEVLADRIATLGVAVVAILLTHGHIDHTGGAGHLSRHTGAAVYVHPDDDFLTLHPADQLKTIFGLVPPGEYDVPRTVERLEHGQIVDHAGISLEVRHTPGHTPGHCCFYAKEEGWLFSGDQLFAGSVGRTDLPGGSWEDLLTSMRDQVMTLPDDVRVLPGHGPDTTVGRERALNPFRGEWASPDG